MSLSAEEAEDAALWLWCRYHVRTEDFDRANCRYRREDVAIPVTPEERRACSANALSERNQLVRGACRLGLDDAAMQRGKDGAMRLTYEGQAEIVRRLDPWR